MKASFGGSDYSGLQGYVFCDKKGCLTSKLHTNKHMRSLNLWLAISCFMFSWFSLAY